MVRAKLFIRTERIPVVRYEMPNTTGGGHWCSAAYRVHSTTSNIPPQDRLAKETLTRSGVEFDIVDLSDIRGGRKLATWLTRIRNTPTLLVEGHPRRKYEGIKAIAQYANKREN